MDKNGEKTTKTKKIDVIYFEQAVRCICLLFHSAAKTIRARMKAFIGKDVEIITRQKRSDLNFPDNY